MGTDLNIRMHADRYQGPCVRKVLLNTHALSDEIKKWRQTKGKKMSGTKRDAVWRRIQTISKNYRDEAMIDKMFSLVTQALSNFKKHGNQVTLGVFDDVVCVAGRKHLRKAYGFDKLWGEVSPLSDLAPKQWVPSGKTPFVALRAAMGLVEFPDSPLELDLSSALSDPNGWLDELLLGAVMAGDGTLKRDVDTCVRVGLDWTFRLLSPDAAHDRLIFEYRGTTIDTCSEDEAGLDFIAEIVGSKDSKPRYDYGSGTCSLYSPCVLGHLNDAIDKGDVSEIRISSCATEADRLVFGICHTGGPTLQRLVLVDLHLFSHGCRHFIDEKDSAWPYLQGFRSMLSHHCPNLRSLVMERVYYHVEDIIGGMVLVEERREWSSVSGVLSGFTSLISEMTTLDEEQRERWSNGEIDADGNDIVAEQ
jgi:hypothetical protein